MADLIRSKNSQLCELQRKLLRTTMADLMRSKTGQLCELQEKLLRKTMADLIRSKNSQLFELQGKLLSAPRSQKRVIKAQIEPLEKDIVELIAKFKSGQERLRAVKAKEDKLAAVLVPHANLFFNMYSYPESAISWPMPESTPVSVIKPHSPHRFLQPPITFL